MRVSILIDYTGNFLSVGRQLRRWLPIMERDCLRNRAR